MQTIQLESQIISTNSIHISSPSTVYAWIIKKDIPNVKKLTDNYKRTVKTLKENGIAVKFSRRESTKAKLNSFKQDDRLIKAIEEYESIYRN